MDPAYNLSHSVPQHYFQSDLTVIRDWYINGRHYAQTCEDWLKLQDKNKRKGLEELERDAKAKGSSIEESQKAFYRYVVIFLSNQYPSPGIRSFPSEDLEFSTSLVLNYSSTTGEKSEPFASSEVVFLRTAAYLGGALVFIYSSGKHKMPCIAHLVQRLAQRNSFSLITVTVKRNEQFGPNDLHHKLVHRKYEDN